MFCSILGTEEARKHFQTWLAHDKYSSSIDAPIRWSIGSIAASGNEIVDALVTEVSHGEREGVVPEPCVCFDV